MTLLKKSNNNIRSWVRWHRRIGISFALPAILLSITGILLNHSETFDLDKTHITNSVILDWYGMQPRTSEKTIAVGRYKISLLEDLLYVDGKRVMEGASAPTGGGEIEKMLVLSTEDAVLLLEKDTLNRIEELGTEALPGGKILSSRVLEGRYLLDTTKGQFSAPADIAQFTADTRSPLNKATFTSSSPEISEMILQDWRGRGLSLWRLILDIHSGKFFGAVGVFLSDIFAITLLILVVTGFYLWKKRSAL